MQTATYEQVTEGLDQTLDFCAGLGLAEEVAGSRIAGATTELAPEAESKPAESTDQPAA